MKRVLLLPIFFIVFFILISNAYSYVIVTVRPGATLSRIAYIHGTTVRSIMSLNGLHNYRIYSGERLRVPHSGYYRRAYYGHYTVRFGDTLSLIAHKYGTSVAELRRLNHLYSNVVRQGVVIKVPERNAHRVYHPTVAYITVRPGATLSRIAYIHGTTVRSIMSLNGLHNYRIYSGERLRVPHSGYYRRAYYGHYTVRFGDTLSLIAHKYGTSVAELRRLNHLYSNVVRQGVVIKVPERNAHRVYHPTVAYITVRPGATLSRIAYIHGTTVRSIMSLNGLHNYRIYSGERLRVPLTGHGYYRRAYYGHYTVRFGDTLSLIAHKYGTSVAELRRLNHLYSNMIKRGAVIRVPEGYKTYRVAGNDQSYGRSERFGAKDNFILGKKIVRVAYRYLGVPYVWGGTSQHNGMDCSGLTQKVFSKLGIHIPRTAAEQARLGKYVPKNRLKPGDLLFFRTYAPYISHVGIYIGHDKFIQENYGAGKATITDLSDAYFERTYAFAKVIR